MKKYLFVLFCLISCEEEIFINFPQESVKIVVEGGIEKGMPPYVYLTKSQTYFANIDTNTYKNLFVNDAEVIVWTTFENGMTDSIYLEKIPDYSLPLYTYLPYWYSLQNSTYAVEDPFFKNWSKENRSYNLIVKWNNNEITSQTTIPNSTTLDCLWVEKSEFPVRENRFNIKGIYNDPFDMQNNVLIKTRRLEHWKIDSLAGEIPQTICTSDPSLNLIDVSSDILINGNQVELGFFREKGGGNRGKWRGEKWKKSYKVDEILDSTRLLPSSYYYTRLKNDVALIKFSQIDINSFRFWRSIVRFNGLDGNPFEEPSNIISNIEGGYGGWVGCGAVYYKIPIKEGYSTNSPLPLDSIEIIDVFQ